MPFIIAMATLAGAAWALWFVLRGSLVTGGVAYLLAVACFGHQFFRVELGPLTMTADRLVLGLLLVAYVVQRRLGQCDPKPWTKTEWLLGALLGALTLSMLGADWLNSPPGDATPLWRLIGGYIQPFLAYTIVRQARITRRDARVLHGAFVALGVYLAFTGLCEVNRQWAFVFPKFIADPKLGLHFGRARGPMVQSVSYGFYLDMALLAAWLCCVQASRVGKLALAALAPLLVAGIYASYTRSVWIGAVLGLAIVLALSLTATWRRLVLGSTLVAAVLIAATRFGELHEFRREGSAADTKSSADVRGAFAYVSWQMFLDRPLWGCGFGEFPRAKLPYLADRQTDLNLEQMRPLVHHNTFLSLLTEAGAIGLALFLGVVAGWVRSSYKLWRDPRSPAWAKRHGAWTLAGLAVYGVQALFHELSYTPIDHSLAFLLAGVAAGLSHKVERDGKIEPGAEARAVARSGFSAALAGDCPASGLR